MSQTQPTVRVTNVKAADPGVAFTLSKQGDALYSLSITVKISKISGDQTVYTSQVILSDPIDDDTMNFLVPFGDSAYNPGDIMSINIQIAFSWMNSGVIVPATVPPVRGAVMADSGKIDTTSNLIKVVTTGMVLSPLDSPGQPMMVSADGQYVGMLNKNGIFMVYPQSKVGDGIISLNPTYNSLLHNDSWQYCELTMLQNGKAFIGSLDLGVGFFSSVAQPGQSLAIINGELSFVNNNGVSLGVVYFQTQLGNDTQAVTQNVHD